MRTAASTVPFALSGTLPTAIFSPGEMWTMPAWSTTPAFPVGLSCFTAELVTNMITPA
jgi:hypothetical protein